MQDIPIKPYTLTSAANNHINNDDNSSIEKDAEEIKSTIKDTERFVSVFLLTVLQAVINEQVKVKQLKREVGDYLYQAVRDAAIKQGWIEWVNE